MKQLVLGLSLISSIAFGQIEKKVDDFNKVTSFDQIDVILLPGNENKVLLNGKGSEEVELVNKKGELKIRMPMTKLMKGDNISATVYFKDLDAVEANEGSRIACSTKIKGNSFDIIAKEGSEVKLILDADKLKVKAANGSKIEIQGNAKNQDVVINSGGIYEAPGFKTEETTITVNAGGRALIFATDLVNAKVRAGGSITISGKPKQINKDVIAGGTICEAK